VPQDRFEPGRYRQMFDALIPTCPRPASSRSAAREEKTYGRCGRGCPRHGHRAGRQSGRDPRCP